MFIRQAENYKYNVISDRFEAMGENCYFPIEIDTEFTHVPCPIIQPSQVNALLLSKPIGSVYKTITCQCRAITEPQGIIYAHPDIADIARHPVFKKEWVVLDYLDDMGYDVEMFRLDNWDTETDYPTMQVDVYAFFGVAELYRMAQGRFKDDLEFLCTQFKGQKIDQGRRLTTSFRSGKTYFDWIQLPWVVVMNGNKYHLRLSIYDTGAVHGNTSYANFCKNTGIELLFKDNFTSEEKGRMLEMYTERPDEFDEYALGDLNNHPALMANSEKFRDIYQALEIEGFYRIPKLTIGATVANIFKAKINNLFDNTDPKYVNAYTNKYCKYATADYLKRKSTSTAAFNAKVDGGRCRNNRPIDTYVQAVLCDIDISSCYGEGLRTQLYPLGRPVLIDYPIDSEINCYQTLRQFIGEYGHELIPGLWQVRVITNPDYQLKYPQDFLASWEPPKDIGKMVTDTENADTDYWWDNDNRGEVKIYNHSVKNAIITHDVLQLIMNVASPRQRKELLDNLYVVTALFYQKSDRVYSIEKLLKCHEEHEGKNITKVKKTRNNMTFKEVIEEEYHKWLGIPLGRLVVDKLLTERKKYPKKTPLNELFKLCTNTLYGDMVSPYFDIGNVVVGNNITARARTLAWCMEKGLHGWQSITDGCVFDLNRVVYPRGRARVNCEWIDTYRIKDSRNFRLAPLGEYDSIELSVTHNLEGCLKLFNEGKATVLNPIESVDWINRAAMEHLRSLFPGLDVLHQPTTNIKGVARTGQFEFEVKPVVIDGNVVSPAYQHGVFHGSANYYLVFENYAPNKAMRSYSKREHRIIYTNTDERIGEDKGFPSDRFLGGLFHPERVLRSDVFIKNRIMKVGDYRRHYGKWKESVVFPGATLEVASMLHEFSLSQFTFLTREQYLSWKKEYSGLMRKYKQSYEMFFLNEDGTLNYQSMVETIDDKIRSGKANFFDGLDKREKHTYRKYMSHKNKETLEMVQGKLNLYYLQSEDEGMTEEEYQEEMNSDYLDDYLVAGDFVGSSWDD